MKKNVSFNRFGRFDHNKSHTELLLTLISKIRWRKLILNKINFTCLYEIARQTDICTPEQGFGIHSCLVIV